MRQLSFSERLRAGWTKEQLIKYYAMTEAQYAKTITCLEQIHNQQVRAFSAER